MSDIDETFTDTEQLRNLAFNLCQEIVKVPGKRPRKRVPNFTVDKKLSLTRLINSKRHVLDSKLTDAKSVAKKKAAWVVIAQEFNKEAVVNKRGVITLKRAWDNLKAATRRGRAAKQGFSTTEDPKPQPAAPLPPEQGIIMVRGVRSLISEIDNEFDSDSVLYKNVNINTEAMNETECTQIDKNDQFDKCALGLDNGQFDPKPSGRRVCDYMRREASLRIKSLEAKKQIELQILKEKLEIEEIKKMAAKVDLEAAEARREASKLELEYQKNRLRCQASTNNIYY